MATVVQSKGPVRCVTVSQTVAANTVIDLDTEVPGAGFSIVVDALGISGAGITQTSTAWTLADSGGTTVIAGYAIGPVAGLIEMSRTFPSGCFGTTALALNLSCAACLNIPLRAYITYHIERTP